MFTPDARKNLIILLIFAVIGSVLFGITVKSPFIADDTIQIVENPDIKSFSGLPSIFKKGFLRLQHLGRKDQWYRPLQAFSYMVDYKFWKLNAAGFHITSIFFHIIDAFLIYICFLMMTGKRSVSFLTGLFFLVHPVNTEAVNYISSRGDLFLVFFMVSAFVLYAKNLSTGTIWTYTGVIICFIMALLSKETAVVFPGIVFAYHFLVIKRFKKRYLFYFLGLLIPLGLYFVVREKMPILHISEVQYALGASPRIINFIRIIASYAAIMLWPLNLSFQRALPPMGFIFDPLFISGLLILIGSFGSFFYFIYRKKGLYSFLILWFFMTFFPTSGLLLPTTSQIAERYMYLPAIALFGLLALYIEKCLMVKALKKWCIAGVSCIVIFWSFAAFFRNVEWTDKLKFFSATVARSPLNDYLVDLADEYADRGQTDKALEIYNRVLREKKTKDDVVLALNNMGNIYCLSGDFDKAADCFKELLGINPLFSRAHLGLGNVYFKTGKVREALEEYNRSLDNGDVYPGTYLNIGTCYEALKDPVSAEKFYKRAIEYDRGFLPGYEKLAFFYVSQNRLKEAGDFGLRAIEIDNKSVQMHILAGNVFLIGGDIDKAEYHYKTVLNMDPKNIVALMNLCQVYLRKGDIDGAGDIARGILTLDPGNKSAISIIEKLEEVGKNKN